MLENIPIKKGETLSCKMCGAVSRIDTKLSIEFFCCDECGYKSPVGYKNKMDFDKLNKGIL